MVEFGYKVQVPLLQIPTPFSAGNNSSDLVYSVFSGLGSAAGSPTPRLLVQRFTLNWAVPVFSPTNPNQSRNRLRLSFGLGSLSICLVHESPSLTIGLSACWTFWISSVDVFCWYPGALAVSLSSESLDELFFLRSNVTSLIGISIWPDGNKSSKFHRVRGQSFSAKLVGFQEIAKFHLQGLPIIRTSCVLSIPVPGFRPYRRQY